MNIQQIKHSLIALTIALFLACSNDKDDSGRTTETTYQRISGISALGRPGSWATNCLNDDCAASNAEGFYLLSSDVNISTLMFSDVPFANGDTERLYSRYRHDAEVTSSLVNFNPSTHAILDAWSQFDQQKTIEDCAADSVCARSVMSNFTIDVETAVVNQLSRLMGTIWDYGRNPFSDSYIAESDPSSPIYDKLDDMHDHFHFDVIEESDELYWQVTDNNATELFRVPLTDLFVDDPNSFSALTDTAMTEALSLPVPNLEEDNPIDLLYLTSPSLAKTITAPVSFLVNTANTRSSNFGPLTITHEVTSPEGFREIIRNNNETMEAVTKLKTAGNYVWLIKVTDSANYSLVQGFVIAVVPGEDDDPIYGGDGSCFTPELTKNTLNLCVETQNGGSLGQCMPINSGSLYTYYSPGPCPREIQNEGALFGVCTVDASEIRIFLYDNPIRPNTVDTFASKQKIAALSCNGQWSNTAPE